MTAFVIAAVLIALLVLGVVLLPLWRDSRNLALSAYRVNDQGYTARGQPVPGIWVVTASGNLEPRFIAPGYLAVWSRK